MRRIAHADAHYGVKELLLIAVAAALVIFTAWYASHTAALANKTYSVHESSQIPATPKKSAS